MRVTVEKLARAYGFLWALRDVDFDLAPGESVALLGPNGAGKTTLLRLLAGLIPPTTGSIHFDRVPFLPHRVDLRARIGMLTALDHLYDDLTVQENLHFFTRLYDRDPRPTAIAEVLQDFNLERRSRELVGHLSSGMKCRLSIAKWRLLDPELLLIDEPYGVLDGSGVDLLEHLVRDRCTRGGIVVMASHHVSRALRLCSRAVILSQGRLTFNETKQQPWPAFDDAFREFLPQDPS